MNLKDAIEWIKTEMECECGSSQVVIDSYWPEGRAVIMVRCLECGLFIDVPSKMIGNCPGSIDD